MKRNECVNHYSSFTEHRAKMPCRTNKNVPGRKQRCVPPLHTAAYSEKPSPNRTQHFVQLIETAAQTCTEFTHAIDGGT